MFVKKKTKVNFKIVLSRGTCVIKVKILAFSTTNSLSMENNVQKQDSHGSAEVLFMWDCIIKVNSIKKQTYHKMSENETSRYFICIQKHENLL